MIEKLTDEDIGTLIAFADNDMKPKKTGRQLYMCGNTVRYRLKKIKKHTGLDPYKFYDLVLLLKLCNVNIFDGKENENASN